MMMILGVAAALIVCGLVIGVVRDIMAARAGGEDFGVVLALLTAAVLVMW